jgi:hypothetical protein
MTVLGKCRNCKAEFSIGGLIGGSANVVMQGCGTACPACGGVADILDGTYSIRDDRLTGLSGPKLTLEVARRLGAIVEKAKDNNAFNATDIIAEIAEVSPELADKIKSRGLGIWALLLLLIWLIKSVELNVTLDLNRLIEQTQGHEHNNGPDQGFEAYPIPEDAIVRTHAQPEIATNQNSSSSNRKERRRQASVERKRTKHA